MDDVPASLNLSLHDFSWATGVSDDFPPDHVTFVLFAAGDESPKNIRSFMLWCVDDAPQQSGDILARVRGFATVRHGARGGDGLQRNAAVRKPQGNGVHHSTQRTVAP